MVRVAVGVPVRPGRGLADGGVVLVLVIAAAGKAVDEALAEDVVDRDDEPAEDRADGDPEGDHHAERVPAIRPGPGGAGHRQDAHNEGEGRHQDRPQALPRGRLRRLDDAHPLLLAHLHAELDDEDRVLGLQPDEHDEPDLPEDVQRHVVEPQPHDRAEGRQRHRQDDHQGADPALVQGGHEEEDADDREGEDVGRHVPGLLLLEGRAGPLVAEPLGQHLGGDPLHRLQGLAGAEARGRGAVELRGGVEVVVRHVDRAEGVLHLAQRAEVDPLPLPVKDVKVLDVLGPGPHAAFGLDHDLPDLTVEVEVVDVEAAEVGLERREDVRDRHVEPPRFVRSMSNFNCGTRAE